MAARAMWKAIIRLGGSELPVKMYAAIQDRNLHFHLLHDQDMVRIKQRMVHPGTGETIPYESLRRGVPINSDTVALLEEDELKSLVPEPSRAIEVQAFVPPSAVNHAWYDRPYYLGPDGDDASYFSLARALAEADQEGIAHWVMRGKRYQGVLAEQDGYLMLVTLRYQEEVINPSDLRPPEGRDLDTKEQRLAEQLIQALKGDFDPATYHDTYREELEELFAAKVRGEEFKVEEEEAREVSDSLAASLEASLEAAGR